MKSYAGLEKFSPNIGGAETPRPSSVMYIKKGRKARWKYTFSTSPDIAAIMMNDVIIVSIYIGHQGLQYHLCCHGIPSG